MSNSTLQPAQDTLHARRKLYGWSSQPPARLHRGRGSNSRGIRDDDKDVGTPQGLPRFSAPREGKVASARTSLSTFWHSFGWKQARRTTRFLLASLIAITMLVMLSRWILSASTTSIHSSVVGMSALPTHSPLSVSRSMKDVDPRPIRRDPSRRKSEQYMAYFPHSGYHNQRISLENALVVAKMLNRTLLVPPVWLGHSIPYISFDKMYNRILQARKDGLEHCKDVRGPNLIPHECLGGYWDYTVLSWDFLVDLGRIARTQPLNDRWDMSYRWLEVNLGIDVEKDMVKIKDSTLYQYRIYDSDSDTAPLDKYRSRLDVSKLRHEFAEVKLLHFGTLFGTTRLRLLDTENYATRSLARASMVFKNEYLDKISNMIRDRLGGDSAYFGVHLRLGDGVFRDRAAIHADRAFRDLCEGKLGINMSILEGVANPARQRDSQAIDVTSHNPVTNIYTKRQGREGLEITRDNSTLLKRKAKTDPHLALPPLKRITGVADSPLHKSLSCRKPMYKQDDLLALNTPIFLATDSSIPDNDPVLKTFFDTFPCIFTLSDFSISAPTILNSEPMLAFEELNKLRNQEDGVPLAKFFYPLIDAMVAAKGRDMLGTPGVSSEALRGYEGIGKTQTPTFAEHVQSVRSGRLASCVPRLADYGARLEQKVTSGR